MRLELWGSPRASVSHSDARGFMSDEPKKPETPGHDVTDGATGKPYSQAGEKSAGQLMYERLASCMLAPDGSPAMMPPWDKLPAKARAKHEFNATVTPKAQTIKAP